MNFALLLRQVAALSIEELRDLLWRVKSLILMLVFALLISIISWSVPSLNYSASNFTIDLLVFNLQAPQLLDLAQFLGNFGFDGATTLAQQAWQIPSPYWMMQFLLLGFYPLLLSVMSADSVTRDLQRGTLRIILSRSSRSSYFLAKLFSHLLVLLLLVVISLVTVSLVVMIKGEHPANFSYVSIGANYFFVSACFILACLMLTLLVSVTSDRIKDALLRIQLVWTLIILLTPLILDYSLLSPRGLIGFMLPIGALAASAAIIYLTWAVLLGVGAYWVFLRKEI